MSEASGERIAYALSQVSQMADAIRVLSEMCEAENRDDLASRGWDIWLHLRRAEKRLKAEAEAKAAEAAGDE